MACFRFPIRNDIEMLEGVEQVGEFLSCYNRRDFGFRFTGRGSSVGGDGCVIELDFDDPGAGEEASCAWRAYWYLLGCRESDQ
jgi:hypothetical protein